MYPSKKSCHVKHTCATRPFQISAFFLSPKGPWPSLKFHCLSKSCVLLLLAIAGAVFEDIVVLVVSDVWGVTKADVATHKAATRLNRITVFIERMVDIKT